MELRLSYENLSKAVIEDMTWDGIIKYILIEETKRRFGSIENFLRKCNLGKDLDKIKEICDKKWKY